VWDITDIQYQNENQMIIRTNLTKKTKRISIKNNSYAFVNWSLYATPAGRNSANKLLIVDKKTVNSEFPIILDTWHVDINGNIVQSTNNVRLPVKQKIYIYDALADPPPPTYDVIARSQLSFNQYSHEIEFDLVKDNNLIKPEELEIGLLATINHDGNIYDSVLTGYNLSNNSNMMHLKFGNIRSTLTDILNYEE
jgi:hypothetical protein